MLIAQYRGQSWQSKLIRFVTRSDWSHTAFLFDDATEKAGERLRNKGRTLTNLQFTKAGSVVEAWLPLVRNVESLSAQHTPCTPVDIFCFDHPLTGSEEENLLLWIEPKIGELYSVWNVLKFITRRPGKCDGSWFCSELVWEGCRSIGRRLHQVTYAWQVPPDWIPRSLALNYKTFEVTQ